MISIPHLYSFITINVRQFRRKTKTARAGDACFPAGKPIHFPVYHLNINRVSRSSIDVFQDDVLDGDFLWILS
jgi:hypothetical protein